MESPVVGIVSFNPDRSLTDLCAALIDQGCRVYVVDNASTAGQEHLEASRLRGAEILSNPENRGVAGALSRVLAGPAAAATWFLTFDQDSQLPEGFVARLIDSEAASVDSVAIVAPVVVDERTRVVQQGRPAGGWFTVPRVITSGAMCRVEALRAVGGFRDDLFIDYVDFDLCARLADSGWQVAVEPGVTLDHSIGALREVRLLGVLTLRTTNHSADRQYYKFRNFVLLTRDGTFSGDWPWAVRSAVALALAPVKVLACESDRRAKLSAMVAGVRDGLRGRSGRRPAGSVRAPTKDQ